MSNSVNPNVLKNFLVNNLGIRKLDQNQAQKYDIDADKYAEVDQDENGIDIDEILNDSDLYEQFATLYVEEKDKKAEAKDAEKEKEEANKVDEKNGAGGA